MSFQICPKCSGQGVVWYPTGCPMMPEWTGDAKPFKCDVCNGKKIIDDETGLPPESEIEIIKEYDYPNQCS